MRFYKFISTILHPVVIPTIVVISYFLIIPNNFGSHQKLTVLALIFITTYVIPLCILILFKRLKLINSFKAETISERKLPVAMMIVLFYFLGNTLYNISYLRDLGLLFYAISLGLAFVYILFILKIKTSLHLLSLGIATGFFLVLGNLYSRSFVVLISIVLILSGILASARLHLKEHSVKEVYLGFLLGFLAAFLLYYIL
jgi:hypothetical protein